MDLLRIHPSVDVQPLWKQHVWKILRPFQTCRNVLGDSYDNYLCGKREARVNVDSQMDVSIVPTEELLTNPH